MLRESVPEPKQGERKVLILENGGENAQAGKPPAVT